VKYKTLSKAILFAAKMHNDSFREGEAGLPYLTHPIEVLSNVRYIGGIVDEELLCAAALHDVLEHTDAKEILLDTFGLRTKSLVLELTRREPSASEIENLTKAEIRSLRSEILLAEIKNQSADAQIIKLADRLANLKQSKIVKTKPKLQRYILQTTKILDIIPKSVNKPLWSAINNELES
jgi:GTP diphosphokinase / guanosine-3',5'-bis(diphosphate) 3'-diphosphatase